MSLEDSFIYGCFGYSDDPSNKFHLNKLMSIDELKFYPKSDFPYYLGEEYSSSLYVINKQLKSWTMNVKLTKKRQEFCFYVLLLKKTSDPFYMKCISIIKSPPFVILSSRRNKTIIPSTIPESLPDLPPFSPVDSYSDIPIPLQLFEAEENDDDEENIPIKGSNKIKQKSVKVDDFKFSDLLPPVCDYDNLKRNDNENVIKPKLSRMESKIAEIKDPMSFNTMEEAIQDLYTSQPNTVYKLNEPGNEDKFIVKVIGHIDSGNSNREEIAYNGLSTIDSYEKMRNGIDMLDRYGNKFTFKGGCFKKTNKS